MNVDLHHWLGACSYSVIGAGVCLWKVATVIGNKFSDIWDEIGASVFGLVVFVVLLVIAMIMVGIGIFALE